MPLSNFLYPNFLRKADRYLLLNHPHIWRTRVHEFGWFSLILGNVFAIFAGLIIATVGYAITERNMNLLYFISIPIPIFVVLFWMIKLSRFKPQLLTYKNTLLTLLIYVACMASLGLNVATLTISVAYHTASLDPYLLSITQNDYKYFSETLDGENSHFDSDGTLAAHNYSEYMLAVQQRYAYIELDSPISRDDFYELRNHTDALMQAKLFVAYPFQNTTMRSSLYTFYHNILAGHWFFVLLMMFFVPTLFFIFHEQGFYKTLLTVFFAGLLGILILSASSSFLGLHLGFYKTNIFWVIMTLLLLLLIKNDFFTRIHSYISGVLLLFVPAFFLVKCLTFIERTHNIPFPALIITLFLLCPVAALCVYLVHRKKYQPV